MTGPPAGVAFNRGVSAVATKTLIDRIGALPPEKRAEVEKFVESLAARTQPVPAEGASDELLQRIDDRRERLRRSSGLFDSVAAIRELRENGD
jgi:hypothetical protein